MHNFTITELQLCAFYTTNMSLKIPLQENDILLYIKEGFKRDKKE